MLRSTGNFHARIGVIGNAAAPFNAHRLRIYSPAAPAKPPKQVSVNADVTLLLSHCAFRPKQPPSLRTAPFVGQCGEGRIVIRPRRVFLPGNFVPLRRVNRRKHRVSFRPDVHTGDFEARGPVDSA
jgi:hypothetical protein